MLVKYNDAMVRTITSFDDPDIIVTNFNSSKLGTQTITITYKGVSTTLDITLVEKSVNSVSIVSNPTKGEYIKGLENLDLTGGKISLTYNDNTFEEKDMTAQGVTVTGFDNTKLGTQTITVSYGGKSATFTVNVKEKVVVSIEVKTGYTQTDFIYGIQKLNGRLVMDISYNDGGRSTLTTGFENQSINITNFDSSKLGKQTITITYEGVSTTLDINLIEKSVSAIEITSIPTKTSYTKDDKQIDLTGGKITLTYNDGTKEQKDMATQGVTAKMIDTTTLGKKEVEITYKGKTAKFEVEVIQNIDYTDTNNGGIIITGKGEEENKEIIIPDKINGKPVTEIGDKAFANREDLISVKIPDSVTKIADNAFEGSPNVTIICNSGSKAEEFAKKHDMNYILEDKTVESISIKTLPIKINYNKGEDLDITGGRILLTYTDKTTSPISMKFTGVTITGYDKTKLGEQQLIVTFREKTTNFDVTVNTESTRKYGDVNGDGKVNAKDLLLLQGHILAEMPGGNTDRLLQGDNFTAGDMDSNGKINAKDLLLLQREILKNM